MSTGAFGTYSQGRRHGAFPTGLSRTQRRTSTGGIRIGEPEETGGERSFLPAKPCFAREVVTYVSGAGMCFRSFAMGLHRRGTVPGFCVKSGWAYGGQTADSRMARVRASSGDGQEPPRWHWIVVPWRCVLGAAFAAASERDGDYIARLADHAGLVRRWQQSGESPKLLEARRGQHFRDHHRRE